jgi:hypothetical protein
VSARDERLIAAGWRIALFLAAVSGASTLFAALSAFAGMAWWGVLGYALTGVVAFLGAQRTVSLNVKLLLAVHANGGRNAIDGEDDE